MAFSSGTLALESLPDFQPGLIVLDLKLEEHNGLELLERLSHSTWRNVPVVVLSAVVKSAARDRALALGAKAFLLKPPSLEYLLELCNRLTQA